MARWMSAMKARWTCEICATSIQHLSAWQAPCAIVEHERFMIMDH
jgi:hypothetical protein